MFRVVAGLLFILGLLSLWPSQGGHKAEAAITSLSASITGASEVPPATNPTTDGSIPRSAAFGSATFVLDDVAMTMTMNATIYNIDCDGTRTVDTFDNLTAAHIHNGILGSNGPVVWGFQGPNNDTTPPDRVITLHPAALGCTIIAKWDGPEGNGTTLNAQVANILAGNTYINFHTTQFPGGEIRGQILPAVIGADLTATKTSSAISVQPNVPWTWTVRVANIGGAAAVFNPGDSVLNDNLPAGPTYAGATWLDPVNVANPGVLFCSIAANVLTCINPAASISPWVIGPGGSLDVRVTATSAVAGTFVNPSTAGGGFCKVDPAGGAAGTGVIVETNEGNNACSNTVTVGTVPVTPGAGAPSAATPGAATPTPIATATPVIAVVPPVIPQVFQNPGAGGIFNGTRNNTPTPVRPVAAAPMVVDPGTLVIRPPSTGDAGLVRGVGHLWSGF